VRTTSSTIDTPKHLLQDTRNHNTPFQTLDIRLNTEDPKPQVTIGPLAAFPTQEQALSHCDAYLMARAREAFRPDAVADLAADQRWYYGRKEIGGGVEVVFLSGGYWALVVMREVEALEV